MAQHTGEQLERLHAALLDAFSRAELAQLARLALDQNLDAIAGPGSLSEAISALTQWAERHGRMGYLAAAAARGRPQSRALAALAAALAGGQRASPSAPPPASPPAGFTIGEIHAANVAGTQFIDQRGATIDMSEKKEIDTGGGAYVGGNVNTGGGDFVGRDKVVHGDEVRGDKVGGDKITVGDITGSSGIAIGRHASAILQAAPSRDELAKALAPVLDAIQRDGATAATQAAAMQQIEALTEELAKGKEADDSRIARILDELARMVPGAVAAVASAFANPLLSGLAGPVTEFLLGQWRRGGA